MAKKVAPEVAPCPDKTSYIYNVGSLCILKSPEEEDLGALRKGGTLYIYVYMRKLI